MNAAESSFGAQDRNPDWRERKRDSDDQPVRHSIGAGHFYDENFEALCPKTLLQSLLKVSGHMTISMRSMSIRLLCRAPR